MSPGLLTEPISLRRKSTGVLPFGETTSSGLRSAASSPSITQQVVAVPDSSLAEGPNPPSRFCTDSSQSAAWLT